MVAEAKAAWNRSLGRFLLAALAAVALASSAAADPSFQGLGDLEGGFVYSEAFGVSADGSVVVGQGHSTSGYEAFRWTQAGGMVGLGDLPGWDFGSVAYGVSSDGSVVVGQSVSGSGYEAFIWDSTNGVQNLKTMLTTNYGLNLTGWTLTAAKGISADGQVIVGYGTNPQGNTEAWRADLHTDTVVPEPFSLAFLGSAFVGVVAFRLRRRKKAS
jgi:probable HAF family extracellular repeat protein